jgi:serine/threonine-protein kinase RsbT
VTTSNFEPGESFQECRIAIDSEDDIVAARGAAREVAKVLRFGIVDQSRIATAVSELTRNVVRYATDGRGDAIIRALRQESAGATGIEIVVSDAGPGIENVERALSDHFTSGTGMGMGLPGTRRLMDELEIDTAPGQGTTVTVRKWHR